jgi:ABC-type dipeptide/oligopeptide/nickel transport system permease component
MGLDQPLPIQLANFIGGVLRGDLGVDVWSNRSVAAIVFEALPHTLALTTLGLGWSVGLGIVLGCFSATRRGGWLDRAIGVLSVSAIAVPSFVVALYSLLVFAVALKWLPAIGAGEATGCATWCCRHSRSGSAGSATSRAWCAPRCSRSWARTTSARRAPSACPSAGSSIATR